MRRALVTAAVTAALSLPLAPALADSTVVVPGLAFPSSDTYLTYFGCVDLYHADTRSPQVRIGRDAAPAGRRSFGLRMPGTGTAAGPVRRVDSVAGTTVAGFAARADQGGTGVAYVWYAPAGLQPGQAWAGRADLQAGAGWQFADTRTPSYAWTLYDTASGAVVADGGRATVAEFTAANGDGPGYLLAGFGCDGQPFVIDALRYGAPGTVTTYDLEGIVLTTSMQASRAQVVPGGEVTLTGAARDGSGAVVGSSLVLEAKAAGQRAFTPVAGTLLPGPDGTVTAVVAPEATTEYRWYLPESGLADAAYSPVTRVEVRPGTR